MKFLILTTILLTSWYFVNCQDEDEKLIYTNARLPTNVFPIEYDLNITTYLPGYKWKEDGRNMSYEGTVTIRLGVKESTKMIVVHSDILTQTIRDITVISRRDPNIKLVYMVPSFKDQFLNMELNEEVHPGDNLEITISFIVFLRQDLRGYYVTKSKKSNGVVMLNAVTQFEPADARMMIPCFDEPELKATWKVTLKYPTGAVGLTNTIEEESFEDGDFTVTTYKRTVRMSSYLLAIFVGDVKYKETTTKKGIRIRVYADPDNIDNVDMALNHSRIVVEGFEKLFGIDFPMEKIDFVSVFDFAFGAMENWGLIVHKAIALLGTDPFVTEVVIHELAHQWFGNLVTMKFWDQTWLNEGFATYMTSYGESLISSDHDREHFYLNLQENAKRKDFNGALNSILYYEDGSIAVQPIFYSKGSAFIRMMEKIVGTENFNRAIRNYLSQHQYSNVEDKDLYAELEAERESLTSEENSISIETFAKCWTHQNAYPTVFVRESVNGVILTQRKETHVSPDYKMFDECGYKWDIPIWYQREGEEKVEFIWFKKEDYELELNVTGAVIINVDSNGYYDVVYSDVLYASISSEIEKNNKIYSGNTKIRLLSDVIKYESIGKNSLHNAIILARAMENDENAYVSRFAKMVEYSAVALLKGLILRSNEDIRIDRNNTSESPEPSVLSKCAPNSKVSDYSMKHSGSEFYACHLLRTRSDATTDSLVELLKTEKSAERRQTIMQLLSCGNKETFRRITNDQSFKWTPVEKMWNSDHLETLDKKEMFHKEIQSLMNF